MKRAYEHNENNSLLLLSRTKQTMHSFITTIQKGILAQYEKEHKEANVELRVIRVNSILNNSESKILQKLCEALKLKAAQKAFYTIEMVDHIKEYFEKNQNVSVLFILEDIEYYIQTMKQQVLLYKILDMFQQIQIKFVFVATSQKMDIVDDFEKRIKSRFSHR